MTNPPSSETLRPTETLEIENGLSLVPRMKLLLTIHCADHSVKPLDEWQLKRSSLKKANAVDGWWIRYLILCSMWETCPSSIGSAHELLSIIVAYSGKLNREFVSTRPNGRVFYLFVLQISREVLDAAARVIQPGVTIDEIDEVVHKATIASGNVDSINEPVYERSLPDSGAGPNAAAAAAQFVRAEVLPSAYFIRPCKGGGSIIHKVDMLVWISCQAS
ncbi:Homeobox-leucine zipper protein REVOLUTA [Camellia lanceoleosa]|uniref:Homeobox-leucine zipper protein REVOLUTA n=1 Tax=Camellia lanceoleosa TaxID=1840588 RepID=A0ACC0HC98_9ERIC|nr:Homeobox-leucine zipper protein REVOLUTA [Camellia lanceoleosa]